LNDAIETIPVDALAQYLRFFYSQLRTQKGGYFSPATLVCIRAGLQRYLAGAPHNRPINIISGPDFAQANTMLKVMEQCSCGKADQDVKGATFMNCTFNINAK
jgi:hypothetical protein